jgi:hypothetical protein
MFLSDGLCFPVKSSALLIWLNCLGLHVVPYHKSFCIRLCAMNIYWANHFKLMSVMISDDGGNVGQCVAYCITQVLCGQVRCICGQQV